MGPTRKNSRHAQQLPLFLGHLPNSRLTVLAPLSGLSTLTQPTSTAFIMPPIPVCVGGEWVASKSNRCRFDNYLCCMCVWLCDSSTTHLPPQSNTPTRFRNQGNAATLVDCLQLCQVLAVMLDRSHRCESAFLVGKIFNQVLRICNISHTLVAWTTSFFERVLRMCE